jgi:hypothetical protein
MPTRMLVERRIRGVNPQTWSKYRPSMRALPAAIGEKPRTLEALYRPMLSRPTLVPKASSAWRTAFSSARPCA